MEHVSPCSLMPNIWMRNSLASMVAPPFPPLPPPPPSLPPLPEATELSSALSDDDDECVFVSGTQSYTLKSMRRNDGSTAASAVSRTATTGFLTILNFFMISCILLYCTLLYNLSSILYFNFIPRERRGWVYKIE